MEHLGKQIDGVVRREVGSDGGSEGRERWVSSGVRFGSARFGKLGQLLTQRWRYGSTGEFVLLGGGCLLYLMNPWYIIRRAHSNFEIFSKLIVPLFCTFVPTCAYLHTNAKATSQHRYTERATGKSSSRVKRWEWDSRQISEINVTQLPLGTLCMQVVRYIYSRSHCNPRNDGRILKPSWPLGSRAEQSVFPPNKGTSQGFRESFVTVSSVFWKSGSERKMCRFTFVPSARGEMRMWCVVYQGTWGGNGTVRYGDRWT